MGIELLDFQRIDVVEEPTPFVWYVSLFGGYKWGDGEVDITDIERRSLICILCDVFEGELHGEVDNGWILGGAVGAQLHENFRAEIEVSHARLDTETTAEETIFEFPIFSETFTTHNEDKLRETFILANIWFGLPLSPILSPYIGGGLGVAHVKGKFGVGPFGEPGNEFSVDINADDWNFAYQLGAGVLIPLSEQVAIDIGYRFKAIPNIDLDDPEFCGDEDCNPPVREFEADDDFDLHEHVAQIGITMGF